VGCAPEQPPPGRLAATTVPGRGLRLENPGASASAPTKAAKTGLSPAKAGVISPLMNPTQKQFSLNREASRKQIPISSCFRGCED